MSINKKRLVEQFNWFQRVMTYPMPDWNKATRMDFFYRFVEFVEIVELCGYKFVKDTKHMYFTHDGHEGDKYLVVATDVVPIEKGELNERLGMM